MSRPVDRYQVPKERCRVETRVSNSRFITTVAPAASAKEAQAFVRSVREEMPDATHHVYAFRIGHGASISEGMSDDGEPSGTSGPPVLAVVRGSGLGDLVVVVTRYFGGTKLGTGGLVTAYTQAAQVALAAVETEEKIARVCLEVTAPYSLHEQVRHWVAEWEGTVEAEQFEAEVRIRFVIPEAHVTALTQKLHGISAGRLTPTPFLPPDLSEPRP